MPRSVRHPEPPFTAASTALQNISGNASQQNRTADEGARNKAAKNWSSKSIPPPNIAQTAFIADAGQTVASEQMAKSVGVSNICAPAGYFSQASINPKNHNPPYRKDVEQTEILRSQPTSLYNNKIRVNVSEKYNSENFIASEVASYASDSAWSDQDLNDLAKISGLADFDLGIKIPLEKTDKNAAAYEFLYEQRGQIAPAVLKSKNDTFYTIKTNKKGNFGIISVGVDEAGNPIAIKEMWGVSEVASLQARNLTPLVQGTSEDDAIREAVLMAALAPELNPRRLIKTPDGRIYLVMDFIHLNAAEVLQRSNNDREVRRFLLKACAGKLADLHELGYIHRDIKLENFLVRPDMTVVLTDVAMATKSVNRKCIFGTYVSPEMVAWGGEQGQAADVYALCVSMLMSPVRVKRGTKFNPFAIRGGNKVLAANQEAIKQFYEFKTGTGFVTNPLAQTMVHKFSHLDSDPVLYEALVYAGLEENPNDRTPAADIVRDMDKLPALSPPNEVSPEETLNMIFPDEEAKEIDQIFAALRSLKSAERSAQR